MILDLPGKKSVIFLLASAVFFILAIIVWLSIPWYYSYSAYSFPQEILLARNVSQSKVWGMENSKDVVLAADLVKSEAHESKLGNRLTTLVYSWIFNLFGDLNVNQLTLVAVVIYALAMVFFATSVFLLFGLEISLIFYLLYIFIPFSWTLVLSFCFSEIALFFLSLALLAYFWGKDKKYYWIYLFLSGILFGCSGLAKEAFFLFIPAFFSFLLITKRKKELLILAVSFLAVITVWWLPKISTSGYALLFTDNEKLAQSTDFGIYCEFFPDPYTYHYDYDGYVKSHAINESWNPLAQFDLIHSQSVSGLRQPTIYERLVIGTYIFIEHCLKFLSVQQFGGVLSFILCAFGAYGLWLKKKELLLFSSLWIAVVVFCLSFVVLAYRSHLMDIIFPVILLMSYGVKIIFDFFNQSINNLWLRRILKIATLLLIIYNFILATQIWVNEIYNINPSAKEAVYVEAIKKIDIKDDEVIAFAGDVYKMSYLTDRSFITFRIETLQKLLEENRVAETLKLYNVKYIVGYPQVLTDQIVGSSTVKNIISSEAVGAGQFNKKSKKDLFRIFN